MQALSSERSFTTIYCPYHENLHFVRLQTQLLSTTTNTTALYNTSSSGDRGRGNRCPGQGGRKIGRFRGVNLQGCCNYCQNLTEHKWNDRPLLLLAHIRTDAETEHEIVSQAAQRALNRRSRHGARKLYPRSIFPLLAPPTNLPRWEGTPAPECSPHLSDEDKTVVLQINEQLRKSFLMIIFGNAKFLLEIEIDCNVNEDTIRMAQKTYVRTVLETFGTPDARPTKSPGEFASEEMVQSQRFTSALWWGNPGTHCDGFSFRVASSLGTDFYYEKETHEIIPLKSIHEQG